MHMVLKDNGEKVSLLCEYQHFIRRLPADVNAHLGKERSQELCECKVEQQQKT